MMSGPVSITIVSVQLHAGRTWRIGQSVIDEHRTYLHLHLFPARAVVEHAVEYGLNPSDSRTVLDWQLHLRFLNHPDAQDRLRFCPYRNPAHQAWAAHRAALQDIKTWVSLSDPKGLLEQIHQAHDAHPVHIIEAMNRVADTRAHVAHVEGPTRG